MFDVPWSGGNEALLATLSEVGMSNRLVSSMKEKGVFLVGSFVQLTAVDILRTQGLGRKSYHEAMTTLNQFGLSLGLELQGWDEELALEARKAMGRRLYRRIYELSPTGWTPCDTIEGELLALLLEVEDKRNAEMLAVFYGFNEFGPRTLEFAGQKYGLTRERVRQIAARAEKKIRSMWRPLICLDTAHEIITSRLGHLFTNEDFYRTAANLKITNIQFHIEGVLQALELIGEAHEITKVRLGELELYGTAKEVGLPKKLLSALRRETSANGCTNIQRLSLLVGMELSEAERIRELLVLFPEVKWLDASSTWLLSDRSTRNRLINVAAKVFSVAPTVEINELRAALRRHVRVNFVPPPESLIGLLEHYGLAQVRNGTAVASSNFEPVELGINDQGFVYAFEALGSPVTREQLEDYCIDQLRMNINSFYVYLSYSPFVTKLATGVFALVGTDVEPGAISQLQDDIRDNRFDETSGWSKAGTLWWHFQADRPTAKTGTRAVPTFIFNLTSGTWSVESPDGLKFGEATIENGFISGFRTTFLALGVANKDFLQFDFDIANRVVFVRLVGDEPEEFTYTTEKDEFDEDLIVDDDQ